MIVDMTRTSMERNFVEAAEHEEAMARPALDNLIANSFTVSGITISWENPSKGWTAVWSDETALQEEETVPEPNPFTVESVPIGPLTADIVCSGIVCGASNDITFTWSGNNLSTNETWNNGAEDAVSQYQCSVD